MCQSCSREAERLQAEYRAARLATSTDLLSVDDLFALVAPIIPEGAEAELAWWMRMINVVADAREEERRWRRTDDNWLADTFRTDGYESARRTPHSFSYEPTETPIYAL